MRSAVLIWPTRISTLVKSSMPILSETAGAAAAATDVPLAAGVLAAGAGAAFVDSVLRLPLFDPLYCFGFVTRGTRSAICQEPCGRQLAPAESVQFEFAEGDRLTEERPDFCGAVGRTEMTAR